MIEWISMKAKSQKEIIISSSKTPTAGSIFLKATLLSLFFAFILLLITGIGVLIFGYFKVNKLVKSANTTIPEIRSLVKEGLNTTPQNTQGYKNILLLGVDSVANKPNSPQLTDTILLISININNGTINTVSLPRDLWSQAYQTRINALYEYGKDRYPEEPEKFSQEVVAELTNINIDHTITLSLITVAEIIDILGGIEIDVKEGFIDTEFPREDINLNLVKNNSELYETVEFKPGLQIMDGERTLKYIRSRKSADLNQGTDIARSNRQQQVIQGLILKAQNFDLLRDSKTLAELYNLYNKDFENQFSKVEAIATMNWLFPHKDNINLNPNTVSIYPNNKNGVITNPPLYKYSGQWVYEIRDITKFQEEIVGYLK